jgi:hypothetical protein
VSDELGGDLCRTSLGDAPADNASAPDIEHQVKVQVYASYGCCKPGNVPTPDLIGSDSPMQPRRAGDLSTGNGAAAAAQPIPTLQAVKGRLRSNVQAAIGELRNQLLRREVSEASAHHELDELRFLRATEGIRWTAVRPTSTIIRIWGTAPTLNGSSRDPGDFACRAQPGAPRLSFANSTED